MNFFKALFGSKVETKQEKKEEENAKNFEVLKYDGVRALQTGQITYAMQCFSHALKLQEDLEIRDHWYVTAICCMPTGSCRNLQRRNPIINRYLFVWPTWPT